MSWNIFERIINAVRPSKNSEQTDTADDTETVHSEVAGDSQPSSQDENTDFDSSPDQTGNNQ